MSGHIDFQAIAALALSHARTLVPQWLPAGKMHGVEWRCGGLDGSPGESFGCNMVTGMWSDFASSDSKSKGGDLIGLYSAIYRKSQADAARELSAQLGSVIEASPAPPAPAPKRVESEWVPIIPVPRHAGPHTEAHWKYGKPTQVWRYLDRDGNLTGFAFRFDPEGERKQIVPQHFAERADGRQEWKWISATKPRGLYGAELLSKPGRVLVVEGEKTADAARRLLGDSMIVVTWPGGSQAVQYADWSMLAGRDCILWPDSDTAGFNAAAQITIQLRHHGAVVRTVELPDDLPKGWDLADAEAEGGWNAPRILDTIDPPPPPPEPEYDFNEPEYDNEPDAAQADFVPLGHDRGRFHFFTSGGGQVRDFSGKDLQTVGCLLELAPLRKWEQDYPGKGDAGFNTRAAGDGLMRACYKVGIFDPERLRGRGAWLDEGRSVLHLGNCCIVDGVESGLVVPRSHSIYEHSSRLSMDLGEAMSSAEANRLRELCAAASWESSGMGQLLAGWCVIAPVCGAMPWRPHLWLAGEGGSGKTWLLDNVVKVITGPMALQVQSKTTEAGIRQTLGCDARPVIFDEAESQNERDRDRVQHVLDLARQASSEDGAAIIKGSASGKAQSFRIRSCFAFSSINVGVTQSADESRTVVLTLIKDPDETNRVETFRRLKALHAEIITPGFSGRLLARTLSLLPTIRTNADVFADAIARSGAGRRAGDTYGVLLAGAWSLRSRSVATAEEADKLVSETKWVRDAVSKGEVEPEWSKAFTALLQHRTRVVSTGRTDEIPVGDLVRAVMTGRTDDGVGPVEAKTALNRLGMRVVDDRLQVSNNSQACMAIYSKTPWAASWSSTLTRMPGALRNAAVARLAGHTTKVFSLPLGSAMSD